MPGRSVCVEARIAPSSLSAPRHGHPSRTCFHHPPRHYHRNTTRTPRDITYYHTSHSLNSRALLPSYSAPPGLGPGRTRPSPCRSDSPWERNCPMLFLAARLTRPLRQDITSQTRPKPAISSPLFVTSPLPLRRPLICRHSFLAQNRPRELLSPIRAFAGPLAAIVISGQGGSRASGVPCFCLLEPRRDVVFPCDIDDGLFLML